MKSLLRPANQVSVALVLLSLLHTNAHAQDSHSAEANKTLNVLFAAEWDYQMEQYPAWASTLGDRGWNDRWSDLSLEAVTKRHSHDREVLAKLAQVDRAALSAPDRLNYDLFKKDYEDRVEGFQYHSYLLPLNQLDGVHTVNQLADALRFTTPKDYEDWLARLEKLPARIAQTIALMRQGVKEGIVYPKVVLQRVPAQIDHQIVSDAKASPLYKPFTRFPESMAEPDRADFANRLRDYSRASRPRLSPAEGLFHKRLLAGRVRSCRHLAIAQRAAMYAHAARHRTTTNPVAVKSTSWAERVRRIRAEMQTIIDKLGFRGSFAEFAKFLRSEPKFYFKSESELLEAYRALSRRIDPALVKVFRNLPRMPYGIEPVPTNVAPDSPVGLYRSPAADGSRSGTFLVNTHEPEIRPKYEMMVLSLHEAVPGHHLQIALAMEQKTCRTFVATAATPRLSRVGAFTPIARRRDGTLRRALFQVRTTHVRNLARQPSGRRHRHAIRCAGNDSKRSTTWSKTPPSKLKSPKSTATSSGRAWVRSTGRSTKISQLRAKAKLVLADKFDIRDFHDELLKTAAAARSIRN
jgi:uncharacterized protein (DUF885 family)